ncbi:MAG TPA: hypothetical protein VE669_12250 [Actinomycetota bacterium]|nr:hypothetical protein [Actinomycetota bacterium]
MRRVRAPALAGVAATLVVTSGILTIAWIPEVPGWLLRSPASDPGRVRSW